MEDLTGLGKLADSQLANKVYDDALSAPAKEVAKLTTDVVKTFRLFTLPFQLAATAQDRIAAWLENVRDRVPEASQTEAPPRLAAQIIRNLVFLKPDDPLVALYLELLARGIDKERQAEAHPAFVTIIEQISPEEALFLYTLAKGDNSATRTITEPNIQVKFDSETGKPKLELGYGVKEDKTQYSEGSTVVTDRTEVLKAICDHLISLNIVEWNEVSQRIGRIGGIGEGEKLIKDYTLVLTDFGNLFVRACVPESYP